MQIVKITPAVYQNNVSHDAKIIIDLDIIITEAYQINSNEVVKGNKRGNNNALFSGV
jgi:hypothetical protein